MKILFILICLGLASCTAVGPSYGDQKGNLVIYRDENAFYAASWIPLKINGLAACRLNHQGFYSTNIDHETNVTADWWDIPGVSSIVAKPGDFIKVEVRNSTIWAQEGGLLGAAVRQGVEGGGPFQFTKVSKAQAERELQTLHQDCAK